VKIEWQLSQWRRDFISCVSNKPSWESFILSASVQSVFLTEVIRNSQSLLHEENRESDRLLAACSNAAKLRRFAAQPNAGRSLQSPLVVLITLQNVKLNRRQDDNFQAMILLGFVSRCGYPFPFFELCCTFKQAVGNRK